jgi:hypothetical protein
MQRITYEEIEIEFGRMHHLAIDDGARGQIAAPVTIFFVGGEEARVMPLKDNVFMWIVYDDRRRSRILPCRLR